MGQATFGSNASYTQWISGATQNMTSGNQAGWDGDGGYSTSFTYGDFQNSMDLITILTPFLNGLADTAQKLAGITGAENNLSDTNNAILAQLQVNLYSTLATAASNVMSSVKTSLNQAFRAMGQ